MNETEEAPQVMSALHVTARPPALVIAATLCIACTFTVGLVTWIVTAHWRNPIVPVICLLIFLLLRATYRGRNWARLLVIGFIVLELLYSPSVFARLVSNINRLRYLVQIALQLFGAVLLMLPAASRWYSKSRTFSMKKFIKRSLLGFCFSTVVAICVHFRSAAIQGMPPIKVSEDPKANGMSKNDFVNDIRRIQYEVYDPIRPVSKQGSFMLKLEKAAYASPDILVSSALSPSFLPAFSYSEQLRQDYRRRLPLGSSLSESIGAAAQVEGLAWGVAQGIGFYLPFFVGRRRKTQGGEDCPSESELTRQGADEHTGVRVRSILDSAIGKCDE